MNSLSNELLELQRAITTCTDKIDVLMEERRDLQRKYDFLRNPNSEYEVIA
jgi:transposase-like protein